MADLKACNILADSMYSQLQNYQLVIKDTDKYLAGADAQIINLTQQKKELFGISELQDKQLKRSKRNNKILKFGLLSVSVVAAVELFFIGYSKTSNSS